MIEKLEEDEILDAIRYYIEHKRKYILLHHLEVQDVEINIDRKGKSISAEVYLTERSYLDSPADSDPDEIEFEEAMEELAPFEEQEVENEPRKGVTVQVSDKFEGY